MKLYESRIFFAVVTLSILFQLASPTAAYADDEPPTTPTEVATEAPPPTEAEPVVAAPTETPAPVITEETATATETPVAVTEASSQPVMETDPEEEPSWEEVLQDLPEQTNVVVLDEEGQAVPLVTEEAAELVAASDPMWCPTGETPGGAGCTISYSTIAELINNLGSKSGAGTIYFTSSYSNNDVTFDHTNSTLVNLTDLTLQGGWNGSTGAAYALFENSVFSVPISVTNWTGAVTINDITVRDAHGYGLSVVTKGNIELNNVESSDNIGDGFSKGAFLENDDGTGNVILNNTTFNNNPLDGVHVVTKGNIWISNMSASGTHEGAGAHLYNAEGKGNVTLAGTNIFINNGREGLIINSNGNVALTNITASDSKTGLGVNVMNGKNVSIDGINEFNGNMTYGLHVLATGYISVSNVTAIGNGLDGVILNNTLGTGNINVTGTNTFNGLGRQGNGLVALSHGTISLLDITATGNTKNGVLLFTPGDATVNGVLTFQNNGQYGIDASAVCSTFSLPDLKVKIKYPTSGTHTFSYPYNYPIYYGQAPAPNVKQHMYCQPKVYVNGVLVYGNLSTLPMFKTGGSHAEFYINCKKQLEYNVTLPNGDRVQITCPASGKAELWRLDSTTLPADLPIGYNYASAFDLKIWQGTESIPYIREGGKVNISFEVPSQEPGMTYSILYWDNGTWVPLKDFLIDEDGNPRVFNLHAEDPRTILSGLKFVQDGDSLRAEVSTNFPGIFVLVQR